MEQDQTTCYSRRFLHRVRFPIGYLAVRRFRRDFDSKIFQDQQLCHELRPKKIMFFCLTCFLGNLSFLKQNRTFPKMRESVKPTVETVSDRNVYQKCFLLPVFGGFL